MGQSTSISWCDSTVNPTSGCDGCELWNTTPQRKVRRCYAGKIHTQYAGGNKAYPGPFEQVDLQPGRMIKSAAFSSLTGVERPDKPWLNKQPRIIFVGDMADVFSKDVPFEYLQTECLDVVDSQDGQRHFWMFLTKQAPRMLQF